MGTSTKRKPTHEGVSNGHVGLFSRNRSIVNTALVEQIEEQLNFRGKNDKTLSAHIGRVNKLLVEVLNDREINFGTLKAIDDLITSNKARMTDNAFLGLTSTLASGWAEKINAFEYLQNSLRNYEGRVIRFLQEKTNSFRGEHKKERVFTNREFMARSIMGRTRGLTLGGGGARALAHVGLLKVLERNKIQVDFISGSSMGAVIGALHSRGESAANIESFVRKYFGGLDTPFDPTIPLISFYKGRKMKAMLKEIFADERIEDTKIPFVTSAIDLHAGEEYVFDKGPFWEALLCTMSLPGVFPPVFMGERLLIDGGVLNNVPDDLIRKKGADKILSVNVSPLKDKSLYQLLEDRASSGRSFFRSLWEYIKYPPILKIMGRASMLEGREITKAKVSRMDLFLHFHLEDFNLFDFSLFQEIIDKGESEAEKNFPEIKKLFLPE